MCGKSRPSAPGLAASLSEIILIDSACLVGAQNIRIRNGARLDETRHPVDQIGGYTRAGANRR